MGAKHERQPMFQLGDFIFTEITSRDDIQHFDKIVAMTFRNEFQRNFGNRKRVDLDRIIQEHTAMDARYEGAIVRFIVTCGKESVGAVSIFFDHPENGLPIEDINHEIDLTSYRRNGTVAEICRLSILNKYRLKPLVFKVLLRGEIDLASECQISYILNDAFSFLDIDAIMQRLPHRYPFLMVDRVVEADAERVVVIKNVTVNEAFFQGHFPGHPIMPSVMITECMVQAAAFLDAPNAEFTDNDASPSSDSRRFYCTGVNVRFKSAVIPGDRLTVTLSLVKQLNAMIKTRGRVTTETGVVAEGDLSLAVQ